MDQFCAILHTLNNQCVCVFFFFTKEHLQHAGLFSDNDHLPSDQLHLSSEGSGSYLGKPVSGQSFHVAL